ncbi:MAG: hypothetical protein LAT67_12860 [Balneolales bacterium]|nr:hypothetical protein [Balneolales bacterium]
MITNQTLAQGRNNRLFVILGIASAVLVLPLMFMSFTKEVNWSAFDFLIGGILLYGAAFSLEFLLRKVKSKKSRILCCLGLFIFFALIWGELAVGIFGTSFAGN